MIEAHQLVKRFGRTIAVDHLDVTLPTRGLVGLLGPNGAGKTTTMRMWLGYLPIDEGSVRVAGYDVFENPLAVKQRTGYLPETPPLYPDLTVGEMLAFAAEVRGVPLATVGRVVERVGLSGWEHRLIGELSKGFRQRVGIAQAIVHDPPVLLLDEPTSGLDPAQVVGLRKLVRELAEERLVVLSTHVLSEVEALCERILVMHRGKIHADGDAAQIAAQAGLLPALELDLDGVGPAADAQLAALPEVTAVEMVGEGAVRRLRLMGDAAMAPVVLAYAAKVGWSVHQARWRTPTLEDAFLKLIGEGA